MILRDATLHDVTEILSVHAEAFPGFFLTEMGAPFLRRLYSAFIRHPHGVVLVAVSNNVVDGFVAGVSRPEGYFRQLLLREGFFFALDALPALIRRPGRIASRLSSALFYRGESPRACINAWLISSLAVKPAEGGRGIGAALLDAFCDRARDGGAPMVYLATDAVGNEPVRAFYLRRGFALVTSRTRPDGRRLDYFSKDLAR